MNGYKKAKELLGEIETLEQMLDAHGRDREENVATVGRQTHDLQTQFINLRLTAALDELAFVKAEFPVSYLRAQRDLYALPIVHPPVHFISIEKAEPTFADSIIEFMRSYFRGFAAVKGRASLSRRG